MRGLSDDQIDQAVLDMLRMIAQNGDRGSINGKRVRRAGPEDGLCVYVRIALEARRRGIIGAEDLDVLTHHPTLRRSLHRLTNRELVFNGGNDSVEEMSFWVVVE